MSGALWGSSIARFDGSGNTNLPGRMPRGMSWLTDTISGFDIYAQGFVERPTIFFDPTATSSLNRGTFNNPYNTQAALQAVISGNMAGHVLGMKRGTTLQVTGTNGLRITAYGESGNPLILCPYGDAEALPIITSGTAVTWTIEDAGANIWKYTVATQTDVWQDAVRLWAKAWNTNAVTTLTADGTSTYNGGVLYIRPYDGENPNLGQMTICVSDYALLLKYSDVAASGYVHVAGLQALYARKTAFEVSAAGSASISSIADLSVVGCKIGRSGVDESTGNVGVGNGLTFYGAGDSSGLRVTDGYIAGNECFDVLNNAVETSGMNGCIIEHNYGHDVGGNSIAELWSSNSNVTVRYNYGNYSSTRNRVRTGTAQCGIWFANYYHNGTDWESGGVDATHAKNASNVAHHNLIVNATTRAIRLSGGTGHKIAHNTAFFDSDVILPGTTTAPQGWFTEGTAAAGFADISNNLFYWKNTTEAHRYPNLMRIDTAFGASASIPTGDNNIYHTAWSMADGTFYATDAAFEGAGDDSTGNFTTYKTVMAAYSLDQNSLTTNTRTGGTLTTALLGFDVDTYTPLAANAAGATTLTGIGTRYKDGQPYVAASATIGALLGT